MKNLKMLRNKKNVTQQELADKLGIDRTSIGKWERHGVLPNKDVLFQIADFFSVSIDYLLGRDFYTDNLSDEEKNLLALYRVSNRQAQDTAFVILQHGTLHLNVDSTPCAREAELSALPGKSPIRIPVVGKAAAGLPIEMIEEYDDSLELDDDRIHCGDFAVIAEGDSMINIGINHGDRVIIRPQPFVENGEVALVAINDGSTIKYFYKDRQGYRLVPANDEYETQFYSSSTEIRILGKFIRVIR